MFLKVVSAGLLLLTLLACDTPVDEPYYTDEIVEIEAHDKLSGRITESDILDAIDINTIVYQHFIDGIEYEDISDGIQGDEGLEYHNMITLPNLEDGVHSSEHKIVIVFTQVER